MYTENTTLLEITLIMILLLDIYTCEGIEGNVNKWLILLNKHQLYSTVYKCKQTCRRIYKQITKVYRTSERIQLHFGECGFSQN